MATWLSIRKQGSGQPHIICPMEKYISTMRKPVGGDQSAFENRCLVVLECFFSLGYGNLFFVGSFEGGAVACLLYGSDNIVG